MAKLAGSPRFSKSLAEFRRSDRLDRESPSQSFRHRLRTHAGSLLNTVLRLARTAVQLHISVEFFKTLPTCSVELRFLGQAYNSAQNGRSR